MKVMHHAVRYLTIMGIYSDNVEVTTFWETIRFIFICNTGFYIVVTQVLFLILQQANITEMATAIYIAGVMAGGGFQMAYLFKYRRDIRIFFKTLEKFINIKIMENSDNKFAATENLVKNVSRGFSTLTLMSSTFYCTFPGAMQFYAYMTDNVTPTTYVATFRDMYYFFDASKSPAYEICYAYFSLNMFVFVFGYTTIEILFVGICLHIVGLYDDLIDTIKKIDSPPDEKYNRIASCIKYHTSIIGFIEMANSFISEMIFIQFCYSLVTIATCVLTGSYAELSLFVTVIVPNMACFAGALFMWCYAGSMVLEKAHSLQLQAYDICWYDYTTKEKKLLQLLMLRTLKPCGMSAFGYYFCENRIFTSIMSNVFSAFAFLRNVVVK